MIVVRECSYVRFGATMPYQGRLGLYGCSSNSYLCEVRLRYWCEMRLEFLGSNAGVDNTLANQHVTFRATHVQFH